MEKYNDRAVPSGSGCAPPAAGEVELTLVRRLTAGMRFRCQADADDAGQEALLRLYEGRRPDSGPWLSAWFHQVMSRLRIDAWRREQRRGEVPLESDGELVTRPKGGSGMICAGDREFLNEFLTSLQGRRRVVGFLRLRHGLDVEHIAEVIETSTSTVKREVRSVCEALRRNLRRNEGEISLVLVDPGPNRPMLDMVLRDVIGGRLSEASDLADAAPIVIATQMTLAEAEDAKAKLEEAGARVQIQIRAS